MIYEINIQEAEAIKGFINTSTPIKQITIFGAGWEEDWFKVVGINFHILEVILERYGYQ